MLCSRKFRRVAWAGVIFLLAMARIESVVRADSTAAPALGAFIFGGPKICCCVAAYKPATTNKAITAVIHCFLLMVLLLKDAKLLYCGQFLHFSHELLGRLECRDVMFRNVDSDIFLDVASYLGCSSFGDE